MIHEVDEALRRLVKQVLHRTDADIAFEAPTKDWAARRNSPTVNLYLYDIREDLRRRQRGLINEYGPDKRVTARHVPPRHIKLSYLITAWTQRPEDEHRLLSDLLLRVLAEEAVPPDLLSGSLAELGLPVPMTIALPPPEDRSFADVWTALGGELKPSLDVVVCAPVDAGRRLPAEQPAHRGVRARMGTDTPVEHHVAEPETTGEAPRVSMRRTRESGP